MVNYLDHPDRRLRPEDFVDCAVEDVARLPLEILSTDGRECEAHETLAGDHRMQFGSDQRGVAPGPSERRRTVRRTIDADDHYWSALNSARHRDSRSISTARSSCLAPFFGRCRRVARDKGPSLDAHALHVAARGGLGGRPGTVCRHSAPASSSRALHCGTSGRPTTPPPRTFWDRVRWTAGDHRSMPVACHHMSVDVATMATGPRSSAWPPTSSPVDAATSVDTPRVCGLTGRNHSRGARNMSGGSGVIQSVERLHWRLGLRCQEARLW